MHRSRLFAPLLLATLAMPAPLPGQQSNALTSLLVELNTGDRVRVLAPPDPMVEGRVASVYAQSIVLDLEAPGPGPEGTPEWTTEIESIDAVWTHGRQTWLGAAIGAGGGLLLGGLAIGAATGLCEYECDTGAGDYVLGGVLFGAAGALVGGLVGSAFSRWSLQFER